MQKQILLGDIDSLLAVCFDKFDTTIAEILSGGMFSSHVSSGAMPAIQSDLEMLKRAYKHFCERPDTLIITELYSLICSLHDRLDLLFRRQITINDSDEESIPIVADYLKTLRALRSRFLYDIRGRDTASDPVDLDGRLHRINSKILLEDQKALERGRFSEIV